MTGQRPRPDESWAGFERWIEEIAKGAANPRFWEEMFGADDTSGGMFFDAEGNDRTALVKALVSRVKHLESRLGGLADRVAVLERIVVTDEARLSEEIEKLRGSGGQ
jgi:hypothetical protein